MRSKTEAVVVSVKKNPTKLACYQEKIFKVSKEIGIAISGMTADARVLCKYMRILNTKNQVKYGSNIGVDFLANKVASKYRAKTNSSGSRPFGVGILLVGLDSEKEPHIYELNPNGDCIEYVGYAIGAKCQSSKTYLEKNMNLFPGSELRQLVLHGLKAIKSGYRDEKEEMTKHNIEVSVIGKDGLFTSLNQNEVDRYLMDLEAFNPEQ